MLTIPSYEMVFPDSPHAMWVRGELDDFLHLPDGYRAEIIGGEIVVSPAPTVPHGGIVQDISDALTFARAKDESYPWRPIQVTNLNFMGIGDAFVPDLIVLDAEMLAAARETQMSSFMPDQVELAVEVTSPRGAENDRPPSPERSARRQPTKWSGYASAEIPYYLLVDRDPKAAHAVLYSIPNQSAAAYLHEETWEFGETIHLPDPFNVSIRSEGWSPWDA